MIKYENKTLNKNFKLNTLKNNKVVKKNIIIRNDYILVLPLMSGYITEAEYKAINNVLKKRLKGLAILVTNVLPSINVTKKPLSVRMGKGKGKIVDKKVPIIKGKIMFKLQVLDKSNVGIVTTIFKKYMKFTSLKLKTVSLTY